MPSRIGTGGMHYKNHYFTPRARESGGGIVAAKNIVRPYQKYRAGYEVGAGGPATAPYAMHYADGIASEQLIIEKIQTRGGTLGDTFYYLFHFSFISSYPSQSPK